MATDTHTRTHPLRRSPRVWAAMLPAPLLGAAWIIGDWVQRRPPEYLLVDGSVVFVCLLLTSGAYALVRRSARNAR